MCLSGHNFIKDKNGGHVTDVSHVYILNVCKIYFVLNLTYTNVILSLH